VETLRQCYEGLPVRTVAHESCAQPPPGSELRQRFEEVAQALELAHFAQKDQVARIGCQGHGLEFLRPQPIVNDLMRQIAEADLPGEDGAFIVAHEEKPGALAEQQLLCRKEKRATRT